MILHPAPAPVNVAFDSVAIVRPAGRAFGHGILRRPSGPTAADLAYESGRTIGLEACEYIAPPAAMTADERRGWNIGMSEALDQLDAHLAEQEQASRWSDLMDRGLVAC